MYATIGTYEAGSQVRSASYLLLVAANACSEEPSRLLIRGSDSGSPALRMLAGEEHSIMSDIGPIFKRAFEELGTEPLGRESAGLLIARQWADSIVNGDATPYEGSKAIGFEVCDPLGDGGELFIFKALASEHELGCRLSPRGNAVLKRLGMSYLERVVTPAGTTSREGS